MFKKTNQADKLKKAIKQHYQQETDSEVIQEAGQRCVDAQTTHVYCEFQEQSKEDIVPEDGHGSSAEAEAPDQEEVCIPPVFVNTRRGKANGTKRKISGTEKESNVQGPPGAAEVVHICPSVNLGFL